MLQSPGVMFESHSEMDSVSMQTRASFEQRNQSVNTLTDAPCPLNEIRDDEFNTYTHTNANKPVNPSESLVSETNGDIALDPDTVVPISSEISHTKPESNVSHTYDDAVIHNVDEYDPANPSHGMTDIPTQETNPTEKTPKSQAHPMDPPSSEPLRVKIAEFKEDSAFPHPSSKSSIKAESPVTHKHGLSEAAWDRLMNLQSLHAFRIAQVSRSCWTRISALPEFAQLFILARFERSLNNINDKNGEMKRIYEEYVNENPQVASLQPVSAGVGGGYAPPLPKSGMNERSVPYAGKMGTEGAHTPRKRSNSDSVRSSASKSVSGDTIDEFGRTVKSPREDPEASIQDAEPSTDHLPTPTQPGRPSQPDRPPATTQIPSPLKRNEKTEMYDRLPRSVRTVLDIMYNENQLPETINDSVLHRLVCLPEHIALRVVENFSNIDLTHIGNLQGFLVGIINRISEKAQVSEDGAYASLSTSDEPSYNAYNPMEKNTIGFDPPRNVYTAPTQDRMSQIAPSIQQHMHELVRRGVLTSVDEFNDQCYQLLAQVTEPMAHEILKRYASANLRNVRNRSGFLVGVIRRCRQEFE
uniref:Uncharacterized protein AlNc14C7G985 n=1 Tax=Albugo laibachii Nc14 TaxID=890382 RepID=F0W1Q5_9STRA|nr:conserved hypothetical protein [Albugo laibachii Nc14]|eukprot:CCA14984.1 conserved hypothetical protein [Albugo laibachii Nc14]